MANSLSLADGNLQHRHHKHSPNHRSKEHSPPLCDQSSAAAVDIIILVLVLGACGFLFTPYFKYVAYEAAEVLPVTFLILGEVVYQAPVAYAAGAIIMFISLIGAWEFYQYKSRRCDNPHCRGLRKAMELDIQLQTEQCIKSGPSVAVSGELPWKEGIEIGQDQKELEAELRRMAPPNGRAVLIFRAPCGCDGSARKALGSSRIKRIILLSGSQVVRMAWSFNLRKFSRRKADEIC
ncbi:hypothetical protein R1flu_028246 [Riccia fluitans]|uniref:Uncharacterized protein n=1 Tax=Riccia fluitans TaxID=41844 RepID=A0ABD1XQ56_9MARC